MTESKEWQELAMRQTRLLTIAGRLLIAQLVVIFAVIALFVLNAVQLRVAPKDVYEMVDKRFTRIEKHLGIEDEPEE